MSYGQFLEYLVRELRKLREQRLPIYLNFRRHREIIHAAYDFVNAANPQAKLYSLWDRLYIPNALAAYSPYKRSIDPNTNEDTLSRKSLRRLLEKI